MLPHYNLHAKKVHISTVCSAYPSIGWKPFVIKHESLKLDFIFVKIKTIDRNLSTQKACGFNLGNLEKKFIALLKSWMFFELRYLKYIFKVNSINIYKIE